MLQLCGLLLSWVGSVIFKKLLYHILQFNSMKEIVVMA